MAIPMKRGRSSGASPARAAKKARASSSGRPRKVEPQGLTKKIGAIKAALMQANALPHSTRKMLCASLNDCFTTGKDDRHPFQASIVEWIGQALATLENGLKEKIAAGRGDLTSIDTERDSLNNAKENASSAVSAKADAVTSSKAAVVEASNATGAAEQALKEAVAAAEAGDKDLTNVERKSASLAAVRTDAFNALKEGTALRANVARMVKQVVKVGEECDFEDAMLKQLPDTLSKDHNERGTFDTMVIEQFEVEYAKAKEAFDMVIRSGAPGKEERAARVQGAKAALQAAVDHEVEAKNALSNAQGELKAAEEQQRSANEQVKNFARDNKAKVQAVENDEKDLANLQKGALQSYEDLKTWDGQPPPKKNPQYKTINGMRYDWQLLHIAKQASSITKEVAEALFTSALDGPGVTPTEKRTLKYIIKHYPIDEESRAYLETKMGSSWYQVIEGVTYERNLLQMAAEATQGIGSAEMPLDVDTVDKLWGSACDYGRVTATEKATLEYILGKYTFTEEGAADLKKKIAKAAVDHE